MKKINCIKKFLFCITLVIIGLFILIDSVYAEVNCDKYACATCKYTFDGDTSIYTFDIKSNGDGTLNVTTSSDNARATIKNKINDSYFKNATTGKIECYPVFMNKVTHKNRFDIEFYSEASNGRKESILSDDSTNNNKSIIEEAVAENYSSCDFYESDRKVKCTIQSNEKEIVKVDCKQDDGTKWNFSIGDSVVEGYTGNCKDTTFSIFCEPRTKKCRLYKGTDNDPNKVTGEETETGDIVNQVEYSCPYIGKINGKNLTISKINNSSWTVSYPDNSKKTFTSSGSNTFPSKDCEDLFYVTNNGKTKFVVIKANTLHTDTQISQLCKGYGNEVEQFCKNGNCKIEKALCGNIMDVDSGDGLGCPWELRAIVVFLKRVVFNTVQLFVPIILIVMGTIDFVKAVASPDDKGNKEAISKFIKRCLAAIFVFFIGTIVSIVMNMFANTDIGEKNDWNTCWTSIK